MKGAVCAVQKVLTEDLLGPYRGIIARGVRTRENGRYTLTTGHADWRMMA